MRLKKTLICLALLGGAGYFTYDFFRAGNWSLPELPDGAYTLSFKNGFRAIVLDADVPDTSKADAPRYFRSLGVANRERRYFGVPFEVQPWFRDAWSWCEKPTEEEKAEIAKMPAHFQKSVELARFEAVCRIYVDDKSVVRGLVFSVPRL